MNGNQTTNTLEQHASRREYTVQLFEEMDKEPGTVSHAAGRLIATTALEDGADKVVNLIKDPQIWRVEACLSDRSTAIKIADTVVTVPETIATAVRIHYEDDDKIRTLPLLGTDTSRAHRYETAVAQFLLTFTEAANGASLDKGELADNLGRWHRNLTSDSISPVWIGRTLQALDVETTDRTVPDRQWIDGELMK